MGKKLDSNEVAAYCNGLGHFTTDDVAKHFKVSRQHAAAPIAIMSLKGWAHPDNPAKDESGTSRWVFTGKGEKFRG
jgi:hypothetical protein